MIAVESQRTRCSISPSTASRSVPAGRGAEAVVIGGVLSGAGAGTGVGEGTTDTLAAQGGARGAGIPHAAAGPGAEEASRMHSGRPAPIDAIDARLLLALAENPRGTALALAEQAGLSRNTVQARLTRLEESG